MRIGRRAAAEMRLCLFYMICFRLKRKMYFFTNTSSRTLVNTGFAGIICMLNSEKGQRRGNFIKYECYLFDHFPFLSDGLLHVNKYVL